MALSRSFVRSSSRARNSLPAARPFRSPGEEEELLGVAAGKQSSRGVQVGDARHLLDALAARGAGPGEDHLAHQRVAVVCVGDELAPALRQEQASAHQHAHEPPGQTNHVASEAGHDCPAPVVAPPQGSPAIGGPYQQRASHQPWQPRRRAGAAADAIAGRRGRSRRYVGRTDRSLISAPRCPPRSRDCSLRLQPTWLSTSRPGHRPPTGGASTRSAHTTRLGMRNKPPTHLHQRMLQR